MNLIVGTRVKARVLSLLWKDFSVKENIFLWLVE